MSRTEKIEEIHAAQTVNMKMNWMLFIEVEKVPQPQKQQLRKRFGLYINEHERAR